ncbi:putative transcription factor, K-box [Helianthus annuus]|nr:putative transcription factor, K-box [Helianthus annuus]
MDTILERYERYAYAEKMLTAPETETQASWTLESSKLKAKIEVLERNIRHYVGEDLEQLNLRELQYVEQQLETALKRIRTKKVTTKIPLFTYYMCKDQIQTRLNIQMGLNMRS